MFPEMEEQVSETDLLLFGSLQLYRTYFRHRFMCMFTGCRGAMCRTCRIYFDVLSNTRNFRLLQFNV